MNSLKLHKRKFSIHMAITLLFFSVCLLAVNIDLVSAASPEYTLLAPIPLDGAGGESSKTTDSEKYIRGLFELIIGLAGGLAVVMLMYAGIKYMSTDAFGEKNEAKGIIENAIWGLLLAIAAWTILYTINPKLVDVNFDLPKQNVSTPTPGGGGGGGGGAACNNCDVPTVPHKLSPLGCKAPGPCYIQTALNAKLVELHKLQPLLVTESYPPTRPHKAGCHSDGSCVDATISSANEANIKKFIENASRVGLNAEFETTTEKRAEDIRKATGLTKSQVFHVPEITGEHFSIYYK